MFSSWNFKTCKLRWCASSVHSRSCKEQQQLLLLLQLQQQHYISTSGSAMCWFDVWLATTKITTTIMTAAISTEFVTSANVARFLTVILILAAGNLLLSLYLEVKVSGVKIKVQQSWNGYCFRKSIKNKFMQKHRGKTLYRHSKSEPFCRHRKSYWLETKSYRLLPDCHVEGLVET